MDPAKIRKKLGRFRALIIGRPNAGKTAILRCIAQSADGRVDPSQGRGAHNIEDELIFSSNPGFVFHDSCGIEAGSTNEMEAIQAFIAERANARSLRKKLHAIWYCIPTDNNRLVTAAEEKFFDQIDPNGVPVILIFTKFESQEADAFHKLQEMSECSVEDALLQAPIKARQIFDQDHLPRFQGRRYPPKEIVYLKNMDREDAQCLEIIELTTKALNNDTLEWLLATVQEVNLAFRTEQMLKSSALRESLHNYTMKNLKDTGLAKQIWRWYPHLIKLPDYDDDHYADAHYADDIYAHYDLFFCEKNANIAISPLVSRKLPWSNSALHAPNIDNHFLRALYFVASLAVAAENSFWLINCTFPLGVKQAAKSYIKSSASTSVSQQIQAVFQDKFLEIPDISQENHLQYARQIAQPLADIIKKNLLAHEQ